MIATLMVTIGNQPLAALAAIVTLKPLYVIPIVSVETTAFVNGLRVACTELGTTVTFAPEIRVSAHEPALIAAESERCTTQPWYADAHFAYTGGTKPMSWAWAAEWDQKRSATALAWYVADDLGQVIADNGTSYPVDQSEHLRFRTVAAMHGWNTGRGNSTSATSLDIHAVKTAVGTSGCAYEHQRVSPLGANNISGEIGIAVMRGWKLTLIKRVPGNRKAGQVETELAELSRAVGGSLAQSVVLGGEPQPTDPLDNLDHIGPAALRRQRRLHITDDNSVYDQLSTWFSATSAVTSHAERADAVLPTDAPSSPSRASKDRQGWLHVTLGLNPLAVVAAALLHSHRHGERLPGIMVLHTNVTSDGAEETDEPIAAFQSSRAFSRNALTAVLERFALRVEFVDCGPHDNPVELQRTLDQIQPALSGAWLDATGGTKALTVAATRAWRHANPVADRSPSSTPSISYTVTKGNWANLRFLDIPPTAPVNVPAALIDITTMVALHGFVLRNDPVLRHLEKEQVERVVSVLEAQGWACQHNRLLFLDELSTDHEKLADLDVIAVKGLVTLVVELKSKTSVSLAELDRTVRRARIVGGSQSLAAVCSKKDAAIATSDVKARFPSGRVASFVEGQEEQLANWANELAT